MTASRVPRFGPCRFLLWLRPRPRKAAGLMLAVDTHDAITSGVAVLSRPRRPMAELLSVTTKLFADNQDLADHGSYVTVSHVGTVSVGFQAPNSTIEDLRALVRVIQAMGVVLLTCRNEDGSTSVTGDFTADG